MTKTQCGTRRSRHRPVAAHKSNIGFTRNSAVFSLFFVAAIAVGATPGFAQQVINGAAPTPLNGQSMLALARRMHPHNERLISALSQPAAAAAGGGGGSVSGCYSCGKASGDGGAALKYCGGCGNVRFCSQQCSVAAWASGHKADCKRLRAQGAPKQLGGPVEAPAADKKGKKTRK